MENQPTCGQGLAEHSVLPSKLGELIASLAENLELHMKVLDLKDQDSRKEHYAYLELSRAHREIAGHLKATGKKMAGYGDLPMGGHDQKTMSNPKLLEAFEKFVALEQELLTLLQKKVARDRKMLVEMSGAGGG